METGSSSSSSSSSKSNSKNSKESSSTKSSKNSSKASSKSPCSAFSQPATGSFFGPPEPAFAPSPSAMPQAEEGSEAGGASAGASASDSAVQECLICCLELSESEVATATATTRLPCGHCRWHEECISQWFQESNTCPICRQRIPRSGNDNDNENENEGRRERSDSAEERRLVLLRLAHARLSLRMVELEEERRGLEMQVHRMEADLSNFRMQLRGATPTAVDPEIVHVSDALEELAAGWRAAQERHDEAFREADGLPGGLGPNNVPPTETLGGAAYNDERVAVLTAAEELLQRLRCAVLRAPTSSVQVFRELASESGGRLSASMLARLLSKFEPSVPQAVVEAAFGRLDEGGKGYVEENDWLRGLNLPRLDILDPRT